MASTCIRSMNRASISSLKSLIVKSRGPANRSQSPFTSSPSLTYRFRFTSRSPVELGCIDASLFPKLSAVATARLTSPMSLTSRSFSSLSQEAKAVVGVLFLVRKFMHSDNGNQFSQST